MTGNEFLFSPNSFASEIFSVFQKDIEKPSYADKPLVFAWHTDWRPRQLEEAEAAIGLPSAKTRDRQLVRGYILGAAIQIGRENLEQWVSYSRNHNYYANPARKRYWPVNNMYAATVSSVDQLADLGLIEHQRMPPGNLHWQSRFRATPELLRLFAEKKIELMLAPPERILLRDAEGHPIEYRDTEQIWRMRRKLEAFNEAAISQTLSLDRRIIREGEPVVTPKNRIGASTVTMFRVFNRSFKMGGRFYGPWFQNIEKELRDTIKINGSSTEEPDYPEHHARLLYDSCERLMPPEPFILDGWPRKVVKAAFYTLLNAETPTAARRAIAELFGRGREGYAKAGQLIAEIERKHPAVANQFGTGAGLWLMRKDSEITEYILGKLRMAKMRARRAPFTDARDGRLKKQIRWAFWRSGGKPLTTTELVKPCYWRVNLQVEKIKSWHRTNVSRVADLLAIRIGRATSQGRPIMWSPRPELMQDRRRVGPKHRRTR